MYSYHAKISICDIIRILHEQDYCELLLTFEPFSVHTLLCKMLK